MATGKGDLVKKIAQKTGSTQKQAAEFMDAFIESVEENLAKKEKVQLVGFGTFMTRKRESREGRNPRTGEKMKIPATTVPVFKPGKGLRDRVEKK